MSFLFWALFKVLVVVWGVIPVLIFLYDSIRNRQFAFESVVFYLIWVALPFTVFGGIFGFHLLTWLKFMSL